MKQLLLENPRRRKRVRRNTYGRRTPLSPLYRNKPITTGMVDEEYKSNFDEIFRKKKTTKKGKKKMAMKRRRRRKGSKGRKKGKLNAGLRRYLAKMRRAKRSKSGTTRRRRRKTSSSKPTRRRRRKASASRGMRRRRRGGRRTRRSAIRTITIPRAKNKRRTYTMKIRVNRRRMGGRSLKGFVSQFTSRENLSLAGGVILAPIVTAFVKGVLPASIRDIGGANSKINTALLSVGIAGVGAMLTNRFSPAIAKGMVISGLASAIKEFIPAGTATASATRYLGEYLDPTRSTGAYIAPRGMGRMGNFANNSAPSGIPSAFNAWAK